MLVMALAGRWAARVAAVSAKFGRGVALRTQGLLEVIRNRRDVKRLSELDERALNDIGLTRSDVDGALGGSIWRDPSRVLADRDVDRQELVRLHERSAHPVADLSALEKPAAC